MSREDIKRRLNIDDEPDDYSTIAQITMPTFNLACLPTPRNETINLSTSIHPISTYLGFNKRDNKVVITLESDIPYEIRGVRASIPVNEFDDIVYSALEAGCKIYEVPEMEKRLESLIDSIINNNFNQSGMLLVRTNIDVALRDAAGIIYSGYLSGDKYPVGYINNISVNVVDNTSSGRTIALQFTCRTFDDQHFECNGRNSIELLYKGRYYGFTENNYRVLTHVANGTNNTMYAMYSSILTGKADDEFIKYISKMKRYNRPVNNTQTALRFNTILDIRDTPNDVDVKITSTKFKDIEV